MPARYPDDPAPWQVLESEYLFRRPPWLVLRREHLRLPGGREIRDYWISEFPDWVTVVAVTPQRRVVMIRQYRPGVKAVHFEVPAGVIDEGDASVEAAARRELLEETGFAGGRWSSLGTLSANTALQTNLTHAFCAEGVVRVADPAPEETEDLRVHLLTLEELARILEQGEVLQALHAAPLLRYLLSQARP